MKRYLLAGLAVFLVIAIAFAPAGLLDRALDDTPALDMIDARGTVWRGQGRLLTHGTDLGQVTWTFEPASLLRLLPRYRWHLAHPNAGLEGTVSSLGKLVHLTVGGALDAALLNDWLARYEINVNGNFDIKMDTLTWDLSAARLTQAEGEVQWSGGDVRYRLSNQIRDARLPPMVAQIQNGSEISPLSQRADPNGTDPQAAPVSVVVFARGTETPLMFASQTREGYVRVGITKRFTKLLNNPWPGSDPDHAIVLEVEERVL